MADVHGAVEKAMAGAMKSTSKNVGIKACKLDEAYLDLELIRNDNRTELIEILDRWPGSKCLVLDAALGGRLNHVVVEGARLLREHGVTTFRELRGDDLGGFEDEPAHIVYLVRALPELMRPIAQQVKGLVRSGFTTDEKRLHIVLLPRRTFVCSKILETEMVLPFLDITELCVDFIALEKDVLSLEIDSSFAEIKLSGDPKSLDTAALAYIKLENLFGRARTIRSLGPAGRAVAERIARYRRKAQISAKKERGDYAPASQRIFGSKPPPSSPQSDWPEKSHIDSVVFFDRECDLITPMITPLTYEGLIDELFPGGIKNAAVKLSEAIVNSDEKKKSSSKQNVSLALNSNDSLFTEIRNLNIERLGQHLGERAKQIRGQYDSFRNNKDASITQIHEFVKQIPGLTQKYKSLQTHINIVEQLKATTDGSYFRERWNFERSILEGELVYDSLEERIAKSEPLLQVLRLLCLQALAQGGVRGITKFDALRRALLHSYGFELLGTLHQLEITHLFTKRKDVLSSAMGGVSSISNVIASSGLATDNSSFATLRKHLKLIVDDVDPQNPQDIAYVSSGYAPLSVRIIQLTAMHGNSWRAISNVLSHLSGPALQYNQTDYTLEELDTLYRNKSLKFFIDPETCRAPLNTPTLVGGSNTIDDELLLAATSIPADNPSNQVIPSLPPPPTNDMLLALQADQDNVKSPHIPADESQKPLQIVYFLGGITYAEIAAIRFIAKQPNFPFRLLIATTGIINGSSLIKSLIFPITNKLKRPDSPADESSSLPPPMSGGRVAVGTLGAFVSSSL